MCYVCYNPSRALVSIIIIDQMFEKKSEINCIERDSSEQLLVIDRAKQMSAN